MKIKLGFNDYVTTNKKPKEIEHLEEEFEIYGCTSPDVHKIYLSDKGDKSHKQQTLLHELVHAILFDLGRNEESYDENLVEGIAKELYVLFTKNDINKILNTIH